MRACSAPPPSRRPTRGKFACQLAIRKNQVSLPGALLLEGQKFITDVLQMDLVFFDHLSLVFRTVGDHREGH